MPPGKIFISYTRSDASTVDPYVEAFRAEGLDCWIDRGEIGSGEDFIERINEGLRACPNAVIFLSASYAANPFTQREMSELTRASLTDESRNVVVVRVDATPVPPLLAPLSWVWAGKPGDLARAFSGRAPQDAHPAALAVDLSRASPPPIGLFLDRLAPPSVEQLAMDCRDHLDRTGLVDRETWFPATVNLVDLSFRVRARPSEIAVDDLAVKTKICKNHRFFINIYTDKLPLISMQVIEPAVRLALQEKLQELDRDRSELRRLLKGLLVGVAGGTVT